MAFSNQQPFYNPIVPFTGSIQGGLSEGKTITITGRVLPGANRFHVNLQCGSREGSDVALHFNPRYDNGLGVVVLNTFQHATWGLEERKSPGPFPWGSNFTLGILVKSDGFQMNTNGNFFVEYKHRIPYQWVDTITVAGGVEVASIFFQDPAPVFPGQLGFPVQNAQHQHLSYFPPQTGFSPPVYPQTLPLVLPYKGKINHISLVRGVTVQGMVNPNAKRFHINLLVGASTVLHYNPRFDENVVVRNSKLNGQWGSEERSGPMPFRRGQPFKMTINRDASCYVISVDGAKLHTFPVRHPIRQNVEEVEVDGDLTLTSVMN